MNDRYALRRLRSPHVSGCSMRWRACLTASAGFVVFVLAAGACGSGDVQGGSGAGVGGTAGATAGGGGANASGTGGMSTGAGGSGGGGAGGGGLGTGGSSAALDGAVADGSALNGADSSPVTSGRDASAAIDSGRGGGSTGRDAATGGEPDAAPIASDGGRAAPSADPTTFGLNGASKCPGSEFAVCEDFEATAVGAVPTGWTREGAWIMAVTASDRARGSNSLQIQVGTDNNGRAFLLKTKAQLGALATKHFGRMYFKMTQPTQSFVHWDFFHGNGPFGGGTNDVRWGFTGTQTVTYLFNVQPSANPEFGTNAPNRLVFDRWTCAEWSLDSTVAGGGESRFWLDGTEIPAFHRTGNLAQIPVFDRLGVGWELFNAGTTPSVAFIDEVVFDGARIGCNN